MIDIVQDSVKAYELPTGMALVVRQSTAGAVGSIARLDGAVTLAPVSTSGATAAVAGPFAAPCRVAVSARGAVSVEILNGASQALVSAHGNLANGQMIFESAPNVLVTDKPGSISTTLTQVAFATIPGRAMGLRTRLQVGCVFDLAGNDSKDVRLFAGPASGTFATATSFGGRFGMTTDRWQPLLGLVWADNSTTALRASASGQPDWTRNNASGGSVALAIDTSLDWNIYVGVKFNLASGSPENNATLRNFWVQCLG